MKALVIEIKFQEALFKTHYTKGFRLTYPIPLPTSVAGVFGALLGLDRFNLLRYFNNVFFGAKLLSYESFFQETTTYIQYKNRKMVRGATITNIINSPKFLMCLVSDEEKIEKIMKKLSNGIEFSPYGGQNDFFFEDLRFLGIKNVDKSFIVENYAPQDFVEKIEFRKNTELQILPVKHKFSKNPNFYFVFNGGLKLKEEILSVEGVAVFPLDKFYYL
jgi:CRISPR-associated Cas5-like protein